MSAGRVLSVALAAFVAFVACGGAVAQAQVPGACHSPDLASLRTDDDRHAAIREYLLCLQEQHRTSEQLGSTAGSVGGGGREADRSSKTDPRGRRTADGRVDRPAD